MGKLLTVAIIGAITDEGQADMTEETLVHSSTVLLSKKPLTHLSWKTPKENKEAFQETQQTIDVLTAQDVTTTSRERVRDVRDRKMRSTASKLPKPNNGPMTGMKPSEKRKAALDQRTKSVAKKGVLGIDNKEDILSQERSDVTTKETLVHSPDAPKLLLKNKRTKIKKRPKRAPSRLRGSNRLIARLYNVPTESSSRRARNLVGSGAAGVASLKQAAKNAEEVRQRAHREVAPEDQRRREEREKVKMWREQSSFAEIGSPGNPEKNPLSPMRK